MYSFILYRWQIGPKSKLPLVLIAWDTLIYSLWRLKAGRQERIKWSSKEWQENTRWAEPGRILFWENKAILDEVLWQTFCQEQTFFAF